MSDDTIAIISTSINERPEDYAKWAEQGVLVVAGDVNTPDSLGDYVKELLGVYLPPGAQEKYIFSDTLGWKCIQRRNAAVMYAYEFGYDYILTVDDDNVPTREDFAKLHSLIVSGEVGMNADTPVIRSTAPESGWINTGDFLMPATWQRGTPYGFKTSWTYANAHRPLDVIVSQAQAVGAPDCDAVTRMTMDPAPDAVWESVIIDPSSTCIFNSQATMWRREWAPLIACLPGVGRYDDVIASVIAQHIMKHRDKAVYVGTPAAYQERNEHDLVKDLRGERWGMKNLPIIKNVIDTVPVYDTDELYDAYARIGQYLEDASALPPDTTKFMAQWANEWRRVALTRT
jgi:hypothetical protein